MQRRTIRRGLVGLAITGLALTGLGLTGSAAQAADPKAPVAVSGKQARGPAVTKATQTAAKGATKYVKVDANGKAVGSSTVTPDAGYVAYVDFQSQLNYCANGLTYTPVRNTSGVTKYIQVVLYNGASSRTFYATVNNGATVYPYFYGVTGATSAYLYVWNGSSYAYDEYLGGANNCNVSVSITTSTGYTGYVLITKRNNGNAYASVESHELAPYGGNGTYTGQHWDYPAPGGGVISRYYYVGTGLRYGILADVYGGMFYSPWRWHGQL